MANPWLAIPEADYIGHMSSPAVGQRAALNRIFRDVLRAVRPRALLVAGCSTGNGFEHVDPAITSRVTAVDINLSYVDRLRDRFADAGFSLDARCADVADMTFDAGAYDLVHAALLLEYVDWRALVPQLASALADRGVLSVVLQRPSRSTPAVSPSPFTTLRLLETLFQFVDGDVLIAQAARYDLRLAARRREPLPSDKAFDVLHFIRQPGQER